MASVEAFYGRWADLYDHIATLPGVARWRQRAAERVADRGATVVEMGCGTGANLPFLREQVGPEGRVVGIDITRPLLDRARTRASEYDNVAVLHGDAVAPPVASADGVLATFVCGLFENPERVVDQWCDRLNDGGRVALLDATPSERPHGVPLNPLFSMFVAAGSPTADARDVLRAPCSGHGTELERRVAASRRALAARARDRRYETFGLGFVGLASGRID